MPLSEYVNRRARLGPQTLIRAAKEANLVLKCGATTMSFEKGAQPVHTRLKDMRQACTPCSWAHSGLPCTRSDLPYAQSTTLGACPSPQLFSLTSGPHTHMHPRILGCVPLPPAVQPQSRPLHPYAPTHARPYSSTFTILQPECAPGS